MNASNSASRTLAPGALWESNNRKRLTFVAGYLYSLMGIGALLLVLSELMVAKL